MVKLKRLICIALIMTFILGVGVYALDISGIDKDNITYEENVNYAEIMINSCREGSEDSLLRAAESELQRNKKIEDMNLDYDQTHFFELLENKEDIIDAVMVFAETGFIYGVTELTVDVDVLNCREEAGTDFEKVAKFNEDTVVKFLKSETDEEGNCWYQISYGDNITGWCMAEYLSAYVKSTAEVAAQVTVAMEAAAVARAAEEAKAAEEAASAINEDDLYYLAAAITKEAGSNWITDEHQMMVGNVILNRVASSAFPDTIYGVLTQKGQYPWASKGINITPTERAYSNARRLLSGERILPENVVYQSTVTQGSGVYTSIYDATLGNTTYFCYY